MKKSVFAPIVVIMVMAVMLGSVSRGLSSTEAAKRQEELDIMLYTLLPHSEAFAEEPYTGEDANIRTVYKAENGYVIETVTNGYAGEISMLVGVSNKGAVTGVVVRELSETPGLGANAYTDTEFLAQFLNTSGNAEIVTAAGSDAWSGASEDVQSSEAEDGGIEISEVEVLGAGELAEDTSGTYASAESSEGSVLVDAMSGATVSSRAVVRGVNAAVAFVTGADVTSGASEWGG